jgi:putative protease
MFKPELLAPAGDIEKLKTAYRYGADACYMGVKSMSMRVKIDDQKGDALEEALRIKKELGKKLYITMNIHAHESRLNFLEKEIERLADLHKKSLDPDGILISDAGVFNQIKNKCPWLPLHVSTQANILNSSAIEFWVKQGATRIVLGREVSLRELQKIRESLKKDKIDVEIEGFVHGAMCMAYSGRCLLSNFMSNRDANEGMCSHSCRWNYKVYLEEELRPGQLIPIEEDQEGTSLMSSKDMCMIEHLKDIVDVGLDSLKIEGRHKTIYYLAITTRAYREALDLAMVGKEPTPEIMDLINSIDTRGYFTGFWYGKPGAEGQKYGKKRNYNDDFAFAGVIQKIEGKQMFVEVKNTMQKGDRLDIITPNQTLPIVLGEFRDAKNGKKVESAHPGQGFTIILDAVKGVSVGDVVRKHLNAENRTTVKITDKKIKKLS